MPPIGKDSESLNPCFNGIWSKSDPTKGIFSTGTMVLILVLMEYGLRVECMDICSIWLCVLILVLMEYGLRGNKKELAIAVSPGS